MTPPARTLVGYFANHRGLELRLYDEAETDLIATEFLSPARAIEIAGKLLKAAHGALLAGAAPTEIQRRPPEPA